MVLTMASRFNQLIVKCFQSNIRRGETYDACNKYCTTDPRSVPNSIYFMSKPRFEYFAFFRFLPPVRTYYKILEAIEKLKIESLLIEDTMTMKAMGETVFTEENGGFKDTVALLKRNQCIPNEASVKDIKYWESCYLRNPPPSGLHLKCLNATVNGEDKFLLGTFDALHQLKEMADIYVRGKITAFIIILASVISLLSVFLVVYANLY